MAPVIGLAEAAESGSNPLNLLPALLPAVGN
jgi:hypothetical protein